MPYFRVQYQGYLEDEYDDKETAVERFLMCLSDVDDDQVDVEEFNEETQEWEPV